MIFIAVARSLAHLPPWRVAQVTRPSKQNFRNAYGRNIVWLLKNNLEHYDEIL